MGPHDVAANDVVTSGIIDLTKRVREMVIESGGPEDFDPTEWTQEWLITPHPALGGRTPGSHMGTIEGRGSVWQLSVTNV
jgi:hypothetical protein